MSSSFSGAFVASHTVEWFARARVCVLAHSPATDSNKQVVYGHYMYGQPPIEDKQIVLMRGTLGIGRWMEERVHERTTVQTLVSSWSWLHCLPLKDATTVTIILFCFCFHSTCQHARACCSGDRVAMLSVSISRGGGGGGIGVGNISTLPGGIGGRGPNVGGRRSSRAANALKSVLGAVQLLKCIAFAALVYVVGTVPCFYQLQYRQHGDGDGRFHRPVNALHAFADRPMLCAFVVLATCTLGLALRAKPRFRKLLELHSRRSLGIRAVVIAAIVILQLHALQRLGATGVVLAEISFE